MISVFINILPLTSISIDSEYLESYQRFYVNKGHKNQSKTVVETVIILA